MTNGKVDKARQQRIRELSTRYGKLCWYCGIDLNVRPIHVDHILPRKQGGGEELTNLALSCKACNMAKGFLTLDEFFAWIDYVRSEKYKRIYDPDKPHPQSSIFIAL